MRSKVDLHDVILFENGGITIVWSVMCSAMVQWNASRKCRSSLQTFLFYQLSWNSLQSLSNIAGYEYIINFQVMQIPMYEQWM